MTTANIKWLSIVLCWAIVFQLTSIDVSAQKKKKNKKNKKVEKLLEDVGSEQKTTGDENPEISRDYIDASKYKVIGDIDGAIAKYEDVLQKDPKNDAAMYELSRLYFENSNLPKALEMAQGAVNGDPSNKWYNMMLAEMYSANSDFKSASKLYGQMVKQFPDNYNFWYDYAYMLIQDDKDKEAIEALDEMESKFGLDENIAQQKKILYMKDGKVDKAAEEIEKLIFINPNDPRYYGMLADVYQSNGQDEKAVKVYERLLDVDEDNPYAYMALGEHYREKGDEDKYQNYMMKAFNNEGLSVDEKIRVLLPYIELVGKDEAKTKQAMDMVDMLVEGHPNSAKAYALKGDFLNRADKMEDALKAYKKSTEFEGSTFMVWQQILFIESDLNRYDDLIKTSKAAIEVFPNQPLPYFFGGFANNRKANHAEAIKLLKQGTLIGSDNTTMAVNMYSQLGDAYNSTKEYEKSDESFEEALRLDDENATTLNNYSYYLSVRNERLEDAEEMAVKANKIEPDNSSFQDTYGWILYRLRKYEEAKDWLEKAYSNGGDKSSTILEHLGDVHYRLDDKTKAIEYWNKAAKADAPDDIELLNKKIADQKLYE